MHEILTWWENLQSAGVWQIVSRDIVAILISAYPKALIEGDCDGNTPLHTIAKIDCHHGRSQFDLVYGGAKCVSGFRNDAGQLPIHVAIENENHHYSKILIDQDYCSMVSQDSGLLKLAITRGASSDIVQEIVRKNPSSASEIDSDGVLPIEYALTKGHASPEVIRALSDAYPDSLSICDKEGELPLHIAAGYYHGQEQGDRVHVLRELGKAYPEAFSSTNEKGELPLHLAIIYESQITDDQSIEVLKAVTEGYTKAHQMADGSGNLPLHVACSFYQNDLSIITYLIDQNPTVLHTVNYNGCFPLHLAAKSDLPIAALQYLIEQFPRVLHMQDCEGNLPLHYAVLRDCFLFESVQLLVDKCPRSASHTNLKGKLPLHLACMNFAPPPVLDLLLAHNPQGLSCYDTDGQLPVHLTCIQRSWQTADDDVTLTRQVDTVGHMLQKMKDTGLPATKDKTPPLFVACISDAPLEVIMLLAERSPELFSDNAANMKPTGKRCFITTPLSPLDLMLHKRFRLKNRKIDDTVSEQQLLEHDVTNNEYLAHVGDKIVEASGDLYLDEKFVPSNDYPSYFNNETSDDNFPSSSLYDDLLNSSLLDEYNDSKYLDNPSCL